MASRPNKSPLKVFILAGQSNMEGQGKVAMNSKRNGGKGTLEYMVKHSKSKEIYKHTVEKNGKWTVRDDVWICYFGRKDGVKKGSLTVGFGADDSKIGPEFQFGYILGDHFDNQVLIIKVAWGGKSLAKDFRPPSSGGKIGPYYTKLLNHIQDSLGNIKKYFPDYDGRGYELVGFGWHQGWNDRVNQKHNDAYESNMVHFIYDIRKSLNAKDLPFVIAETGMSGYEEKHPRALSLMKAQANVAKRKEFQGNVAFVETKGYYRPREISPSGQGYHWNSNGETLFLIGDGMGKAMKKLLKK